MLSKIINDETSNINIIPVISRNLSNDNNINLTIYSSKHNELLNINEEIFENIKKSEYTICIKELFQNNSLFGYIVVCSSKKAIE